MKEYTVYFVIKEYGHEYLKEKTLFAHNQKEAIKVTRSTVKEFTGKNAFYCTTKKPVVIDNICYYRDNGFYRIYPYYNNLSNCLH